MHRLLASLVDRWPPERWRKTRLLLAVSGGADSVALLRAMLEAVDRTDLIDVAHFNHRLRGEESDADERFVRDLCAEYRLRCYCGQADAAPSCRLSEKTARDDRYRFLTSVAYDVGARYVVTAHTASDRVETMLHNLFRGSGIAGMRGPISFRNLSEELVLARPLLSCSRADVLDYLVSQEQPFREDRSNQDQAYRRNYIRHSLLPSVRQRYDPGTDTRLLAFCEMAEELQEVLDESARQFLASLEKNNKPQRRSDAVATSHESESVAFRLPLRSEVGVGWPVVHAALQVVWQQHRWPLQQMTRQHWLKLRGMWECEESEDSSADSTAATASVMQLPGRLTVAMRDGWIEISS